MTGGGRAAMEAEIELTTINVKFTAKELELLGRLASDQLFRREFIDSRMPGRTPDTEELNLGKQLVERLRAVTGRGVQTPHLRKNGASV